MLVDIVLHPFIIPDENLFKKLQEKSNEGDLFIFPDLTAAVKAQHLLCFGWVNWVKFENSLITFTCRVIEDTDKQIAINYKMEDKNTKEIINLYLV
jgi:hypothetical protein